MSLASPSIRQVGARVILRDRDAMSIMNGSKARPYIEYDCTYFDGKDCDIIQQADGEQEIGFLCHFASRLHRYRRNIDPTPH